MFYYTMCYECFKLFAKFTYDCARKDNYGLVYDLYEVKYFKLLLGGLPGRDILCLYGLNMMSFILM